MNQAMAHRASLKKSGFPAFFTEKPDARPGFSSFVVFWAGDL
jgi:hypothetical protein